jgi:glycosyltransferase involved in cell wall biosynthesis
MVYAAKWGSRAATIVFKYAAQWLETLRILRREQPDAVFVMTPPVFAALPAFWYARGRRASVVLDAHTAAFLHPRWRRFQWLQRALCRRAATTLVSNEHLAGIVQSAGGHATVVPDVPVVFPERGSFTRPAGFAVAVVCSFNYDEPVAAMFEAARSVPDVQFLVTGHPRHLDRSAAAKMPANVRLTGFLSVPAYGSLLSSADVVMTLTTRDHTMLRGAYEAIYQGTPVIVSNWPVLIEAFPIGAAHVDNSAGAIARAVRSMQRDIDRYRVEAARLRDVKLSQWQSTRDAILERLGAGAGVTELTSDMARV